MNKRNKILEDLHAVMKEIAGDEEQDDCDGCDMCDECDEHSEPPVTEFWPIAKIVRELKMQNKGIEMVHRQAISNREAVAEKDNQSYEMRKRLKELGQTQTRHFRMLNSTDGKLQANNHKLDSLMTLVNSLTDRFSNLKKRFRDREERHNELIKIVARLERCTNYNDEELRIGVTKANDEIIRLYRVLERAGIRTTGEL